MNCCNNPRISNFRFGGSYGSPVTNNYFCHSCKAHEYGEVGKEKFYTRQEWEAYVNEVTE